MRQISSILAGQLSHSILSSLEKLNMYTRSCSATIKDYILSIVKWNKLILSLILCFGIAALGSTLTIPSVTGWFSTLNKPPFSPPNWLFGPVWSVLYLLMAVSFYLIWSKKHSPFAIRIFLLQLFLNLGWSFIFFYLHRPGLAFLEILILWWAILATIKTFYKTYHLAAYLLYPYLAWVSFAAFLNFSLWQLNR